jgi:hypothetical protein
MDGLNSESFCLQDLVPSSSTSDRSAHHPSTTGHSNSQRSEAADTFAADQAAVAASSSYRFSAMQPFPCPPTSHFMSQPVQPLPLPYPQVSHIPTSVHSYHPQPQSGFNSMNGTSGLRASAHPHFVDHESPADYFDKNQQSACPLKSHPEEKRKGESETSI